MDEPISCETHPDRYRHWTLSFDGPVATLGMDVREDAGLKDDYRLKLNSYDLGGGHRAGGRDSAHPVRASRGAGRRHPQPEGAHLLRRREHLHAGRLGARLQGELLQVHQRDAARDGRRQRAFRHQVHLRGQRHLRRRRLRTGARLRRDPDGRRRERGGQPAGNAAARRAARHRRPDAHDRQAQGPPRPRRHVLHAGRRREGQALRAVGPRRRRLSDQPLQGGGRRTRPRARRALRSSRAGRRPPRPAR